MLPTTRPFPGLTGPARRARWRRGVLRRLLAALCAAAAVIVALAVVRPPPDPTVPVLLATRPVAAGAVLRPGDVAVARVVTAARQPGALDAADQAVGRRPGAALAAGEALTTTRLVPRTPAEGLAPGEVALHVLLADPSAVDLLTPGQVVDVYPATGGAALARGATVLSLDPLTSGDALSVTSAGPGRGLVLALAGDGAERVLVGHGGLDGPAVVAVVALAQ